MDPRNAHFGTLIATIDFLPAGKALSHQKQNLYSLKSRFIKTTVTDFETVLPCKQTCLAHRMEPSSFLGN
jgi:hypothetical protein